MHEHDDNQYYDDTDLEEHNTLNGFYRSRSFDFVYVSKDGKFYHEGYKRFLFVHMTKNGYPTVRIAGINRYVHRLLAETFIVVPDWVTNPWVNHRNGDKHDFKLSNLEWTTPSGNSDHAFRNNLRADNKPVLLKDIATEKITRYHSLNECCRAMGKNAARPSEFLSGSNSTPLYGKWDLIWEDDTWNNFTKEDLGRVRSGVPRALVAENELGIIIFASSTEAANKLGISRTVISDRANGKKSSTVNGYRFRWLHLHNCDKAT